MKPLPIHTSYKLGIVLVTGCFCILAFFYVQPIAQPPEYHIFADRRMFYKIPNFWNVMSNLPFIIFGITGLNACSSMCLNPELFKLQRFYTLFFTSSVLTGFGSGYYHLDPSNHTLVLDRLPMTIAFMAFFSLILAKYISLNLGRVLLLPLLAAGMISVLYWYKTEQGGGGDLRPYLLIQFLPVLLTIIILVLFRINLQYDIYIWTILIIYLLSKLAEILDSEIYFLTSSISGHTLKHLLASTAVLVFYLYFTKRLKQNG